MKKAFVGFAMVVACVMFNGCASVPKYVNMTGQWKYKFVESGKDDIETGSMKLKQDGVALSGQANDSYGEFVLTGTLEGPNLTINGIRNDQKRSFKILAKIEDENKFEGTFSTDQKTTGEINGTRIIAE
jgi:hypothetical protein